MNTKEVEHWHCGCVLEAIDGISGHALHYCPKHAAAPDMYEALKEIKAYALAQLDSVPVDQQVIVGKCFLALAKAEGR